MINVINKENCTGCHACSNICPKNCIKMEYDEEGFKYPNVNVCDCINCNLCERICPILHEKKIKNNPKAFGCYNKDESVRSKSSSGGVFTLIAERVIENNGVVFGATFNKEFNVIHDYTENIEEIFRFRGSKYVQSDIGRTYYIVKQFLDKDRYVLFSGTPCQISGLKRYLQKEYENLICLDLVCHGVPSSKAWNKYKDTISKGKEIKNINFRDKRFGWKSYSMRMKFMDNTETLIRGKDDSFIKGFIANIYLRPSCYNCKFKSINRESDITLADFWGVNNLLEEIDDDKGISLIFVNSKKGSNMFESIIKNIDKIEVDIYEAIKYNKSAIEPSYYNSRRKYFYKNIDRIEFNRLIQRSLDDELKIKIKIKVYELLKKIIS